MIRKNEKIKTEILYILPLIIILVFFSEIIYTKINNDSSYIIHEVEAGDSLWLISKKYDVSVSEIKEANGLTSNILFSGFKLKIPKSKINNNISPEKKKKLRKIYKNRFLNPIQEKISQHYGVRDKIFNQGITFITRKGKSIKASQSGRIIFNGKVRGYGNTIIIKHSNDFFTVYSSMSINFYLSRGQYVKKGQVIAKNNTNSNVEVFFQLYNKNRTLNPSNFIS